MKAKVIITFECEMQDVRDLEENIYKNIKPMMDFYHAGAKVTIIPSEATFMVEGLWNG